jgi:hypothetical protein
MFPEKSGLGWLSRDSDTLRAGRSGNRILVEYRFSAPVPTRPGAHPASCTKGTCFLSPGISRRGHGFDYPPTSSSGVKERVQVYMFRPFGPSWFVIGLILPLPLLSKQNYSIIFVMHDLFNTYFNFGFIEQTVQGHNFRNHKRKMPLDKRPKWQQRLLFTDP